MNNNNPFQPTNVAPPVLTPNGDNVGGFSSANKRPSVMLDGISPNYYDNSQNANNNTATGNAPVESAEPTTPDIISQALVQDATENASFSAIDNTGDSSLADNTPVSTPAPQEFQNPDPVSEPAPLATPDMLNTDYIDLDAPTEAPIETPSVSSNPTVDKIAELAEQADSQSLASTPEENITPAPEAKPASKKAKKVKNSKPVPVAEPEPEFESTVPQKTGKTFSISILTLIFFIVSILGIGGTIFFLIQNNGNSSKLSVANAQVSELQDKLSQITGSDNKDNNQYNALQDRIIELTKQNEEKQKTLDEQGKKITDLETRNKDLDAKSKELETKNADLSSKVTDISDLTTQLKNVLTNCKIQDTNAQSPKSCSISITAEEGQN